MISLIELGVVVVITVLAMVCGALIAAEADSGVGAIFNVSLGGGLGAFTGGLVAAHQFAGVAGFAGAGIAATGGAVVAIAVCGFGNEVF